MQARKNRSARNGRKKPFARGLGARGGHRLLSPPSAPGIGLVCGNLDQNGNPVPVVGSLIVIDCDFRLMTAIADYDRLASESLSKKRPNATRLRKIAEHLRTIAPTLVEKEQSLGRLLREQPTLAKLRASTLERGRANSPNFALLAGNGSALGNDTPKLYLPLEVDGKTELIEAFGVDRLAAGKQLVGYHLHPESGRPWLWENGRSPEDTSLAELPQINAEQWDALWGEIAGAGSTLGFVEGGAGVKANGGREGPKGVVTSVCVGPLGEIPEHIAKRFTARSNIPLKKIEEPPPVETMHAMLEHLADKNYFEHREDVLKDADDRIVKIGWLETGMALKLAYGDEFGFDLWWITHIDERARNDAPGQWTSFASELRAGHVTIGLIIKAAKDAGFVSASSRADATEPGYASHGPFTMDADNGLTKEIVRRGKNATVETVWICAPLEVLGACRDPQGCAWGKQLRFRDADNRMHMRHVSDAALQGEPATLCATLAHEGLRIDRSRQREFAEYLSAVGVGARVTIVNRTGWHEVDGQPVFTLPTETIASGIGETVVLDQMANGPYEARGALEDWKQGVGALTAGHALPCSW
jgi:hypothetical protein